MKLTPVLAIVSLCIGIIMILLNDAPGFYACFGAFIGFGMSIPLERE